MSNNIINFTSNNLLIIKTPKNLIKIHLEDNEDSNGEEILSKISDVLYEDNIEPTIKEDR